MIFLAQLHWTPLNCDLVIEGKTLGQWDTTILQFHAGFPQRLQQSYRVVDPVVGINQPAPPSTVRIVRIYTDLYHFKDIHNTTPIKNATQDLIWLSNILNLP